MAELKITANITQAQTQLKALDKELDALKTKGKQIEINIKSITQAVNSAKSLADANTKLEAATQKRITAEKNLEKEQTKQITQEVKLRTEIEKSAREREKTAQTANRRAAAEVSANARIVQAEQRTQQEMLKTQRASERLGDAWKRMFSAFSVSNIVSSGVTRAISQMRSYFNEALNEMKQLDTALTHYRQVTGESAQQAATIGSKAYSVGSKYGTSASDYAESVATYARAGYKETADQLAELSLKTVIVGQTTQEIADQFLLTMDAAYGYKGSVEELSKVLDGASAIDSTYATTIEKIAAGLGLVAPLAQQVHVSEKELTAAIGTITAVTQRSGAESARALRSLFLNILKDTSTEIEEGVTATEESVADMQTLLNKYAKSAVLAAKASGEVINPMEAIGALAKSMKEGLLTEAELMDMMSSLGGKLRVSQLVALVSNWDMYNNMIGTYENSIGSADQKTTMYLDSWEAKVNILKNTWTEFIAKTIDTDMFKGFLDGATNLLKIIGNLKNAVVLLGGAFTGLKLGAVAADFRKVAKESTDAAEAAAASAKASALGWAGIAVSAITTVYSAYEMYHEHKMQALKEETDKAVEAAKIEQQSAADVSSAYETYFNAQKALDAGTISTETYEKAVRNLADALGEEVSALDEAGRSIDELSLKELKHSKRKTEEAVRAAQAETRGDLTKFRIANNNPIYAAYNQLEMTGLVNGQATYRVRTEEERLQSAIEKYKELVRIRDSYLHGNKLISEKEYNDAVKALGGVSDSFATLIEQQDALDDINTAIEKIANGDINPKTIDELNDALNGTSDATDDVASGASNVEESFNGLAKAVHDAKKELEEYKTAASEEMDDPYKDAAKAWASVDEDIKAGKTNSANVRAFADFAFTPEQQAALFKKGISVAEELGSDFWKKVMTYLDEEGVEQYINGEDSGSQVGWYLYDEIASKTGGIIEYNNRIVASFKDVDGQLDISVESFDDLSKALSELYGLNVSPEFLAVAFQGMGVFAEDTWLTADAVEELAKQLNAIDENGVVNIDVLLDNAAKEGYTKEQIDELRESLERLRDENQVEVDVETGGIDGASQKAEQLAAKRTITFTDNTEETKKDINGVQVLVDTLMKDSPYKVQVDAAVEQATTALTNFRTTAKNIIENNPVTLTIKTMVQGQHNATGSRNNPGGLSVVNEQAPELIVEGDTARIAGSGKPTLTWLQSGADVYNASQTRAILGSSIPSELFDGIGAYGNGTIVTDIPRWTPPTKETKEDTSSSGTGTGTDTNRSKTKSSSKDKDEQLEKLKEIVELRKSALALAEAEDASIKNQIKKQRAVKDAIEDQIKYMKQKKYPQKDINALLTEQLKIEKEIANLNKQLYDNLQKSVNKEIDNLNKKRDQEKQKIQDQIDALQKENEEKQKSVELEEKTLAVQEAKEKLRNAKNQRTVRYYNATSGQWEWAANANEVKSAQEALDEAKKSLSEYKADQKLDRQIAKLEKQQEKVDTKYDKQIDLLQQIIDSFEEPVGSIKKAVKQIEKNATKDQKTTINALNKLLVKALGKGYKISTKGLYDSGGILQGVGGIKGTTADEIVLPPDITSSMLKPISTATLNNRLNELRYLYGATGGIAGITNSNTIGSQHIGDLYNLGGVTLTEGQARSTTVYDLIQMSRGLRAFNAM